MPTDLGYSDTVTCAALQDVATLSALAAGLTNRELAHEQTSWPMASLEILTEAFAVLIGHALRCGSVDVLPGGRGVAVWLDRTGPSPQSPADEPVTSGPVAAVLRRLVGDSEPGIAHVHLATIAAVDAYAAAALLAYRHRRLDRVGATAYTVARGPAPAATLTAAGYLPAPPAPGRDGSRWWRMVRPPAGSLLRRRAAAIALWPPDIDR